MECFTWNSLFGFKLQGLLGACIQKQYGNTVEALFGGTSTPLYLVDWGVSLWSDWTLKPLAWYVALQSSLKQAICDEYKACLSAWSWPCLPQPLKALLLCEVKQLEQGAIKLSECEPPASCLR